MTAVRARTRPPEEDSVFGPTLCGVPNPVVPVSTPYPTRFRGPVWWYPQQSGASFVTRPLSVPVALRVGGFAAADRWAKLEAAVARAPRSCSGFGSLGGCTLPSLVVPTPSCSGFGEGPDGIGGFADEHPYVLAGVLVAAGVLAAALIASSSSG